MRDKHTIQQELEDRNQELKSKRNERDALDLEGIAEDDKQAMKESALNGGNYTDVVPALPDAEKKAEFLDYQIEALIEGVMELEIERDLVLAAEADERAQSLSPLVQEAVAAEKEAVEQAKRRRGEQDAAVREGSNRRSKANDRRKRLQARRQPAEPEHRVHKNEGKTLSPEEQAEVNAGYRRALYGTNPDGSPKNPKRK